MILDIPILKNELYFYPNYDICFRVVEVDYDTDDSGRFRARAQNELAKNAPIILDSTSTKINTPFDMMEAQQIEEELDSTSKGLHSLRLM